MNGMTLTAQRFHAHYSLDEQRAAVVVLVNSGMGDHAVSELTGLSVLQVRRLVADQRVLIEQSAGSA